MCNNLDECSCFEGYIGDDCSDNRPISKSSTSKMCITCVCVCVTVYSKNRLIWYSVSPEWFYSKSSFFSRLIREQMKLSIFEVKMLSFPDAILMDKMAEKWAVELYRIWISNETILFNYVCENEYVSVECCTSLPPLQVNLRCLF